MPDTDNSSQDHNTNKQSSSPQNKKLLRLLNVVIDNYIQKGEPIWSKYLHSLEETTYAPSTLRKYLHMLEQSGLVYQPYNSSGRIPTVDGLVAYIEQYINDIHKENDEWFDPVELDVEYARMSLRNLAESLWKFVDGVVVAFLPNDEYYFLGINNLLKDSRRDDYETTSYIVDFIEGRSIIDFVSKKILKRHQVYYTFVQEDKKILSCVYTKISINDYDAIVSVVWPARVQYKKNIAILRKIIELMH